MDMPAARKLAHCQVAALIDVNQGTGEGDLYVGMEDLDDDDRSRLDRAITEIIDYHLKRSV